MKSTGIVRKVDELGRVVIPIEVRRTLGIKEKDPIEIFIDGEQIVLKKYTAAKSCFVTGEVNDDNISLLDGRLVLTPASAEYLLNELKKSVKS